MKRILVHIGFAVRVLSLIPLCESRAQTSVGKKTSIKIIYSALTASNAPVWVGSDQNLYEKYGLAAKLSMVAALRRFRRLPAARFNLAILPEPR